MNKYRQEPGRRIRKSWLSRASPYVKTPNRLRKVPEKEVVHLFHRFRKSVRHDIKTKATSGSSGSRMWMRDVECNQSNVQIDEACLQIMCDQCEERSEAGRVVEWFIVCDLHGLFDQVDT